MAAPELPPQAVLLQLVGGRRITQALGVAVDLGLADLLKDGPLAADELARRCQAHPRALYRLMRALAMVGVFAEQEGQCFSLTPVGECLRTDLPGSLAGMARFHAAPFHGQAWLQLGHAVRTEESAFEKGFGQPVFQWFGEHPKEAAVFNDAMTAFSSSVGPAVAAAFDWSRFAKIADVGGGHGALIAAILGQATAARGILFDLPKVVAGATALLERAGVAARCEVLGGDFFETVPKGCDAIVMKSIVHDWSDEKAGGILRNCAAALAPGGRVVLVETVIPPPGVPSYGKLLDLDMMVFTHGGRERTEAEFGALLAGAGLELVRVHPTKSPLFLIEAKRRS